MYFPREGRAGAALETRPVSNAWLASQVFFSRLSGIGLIVKSPAEDYPLNHKRKLSGVLLSPERFIMNIISSIRHATTKNGRRCFRVTNAVIVALSMLVLTVSCGTSGSGDNKNHTVSAANSSEPSSPAYDNQLTMTTDAYGLQTPNYFYSTDNQAFWSIQADIAKSVHDPDFRCIIRIDIWKSAGMPALNKTYSLSPDPGYETFPGRLYVFNGHQSVMKKVEQGILAFAPANSASAIEGTFDVVMTDYDSRLLPVPQYHLAGAFRFRMNTYGPAAPPPNEVFPALGKDVYDQSCAACHGLGEYDVLMESASDLSMRGGELPVVYDPAAAHHQSISIDENALQALRIFVNVW